MMKANLRLVVSVKEVSGQRAELLDLIRRDPSGSSVPLRNLIRPVATNFPRTPQWIRQGMTRAIACQSAPFVCCASDERLTTIRKVSLDLAHKLGAMPSRVEIAEAMDISLDELDSLLRQALTTSSLDAPVNGEKVAFSVISSPIPPWMSRSTSLSSAFITNSSAAGSAISANRSSTF